MTVNKQGKSKVYVGSLNCSYVLEILVLNTTHNNALSLEANPSQAEDLVSCKKLHFVRKSVSRYLQTQHVTI